MKLEQLSYFREAAKQQNLAKASKVLNISVSSIAHAIRCLESDLGIKLFKKEGRNIYLTEKGRALAEMSAEVFFCIEKIKSELQSDQVIWKGSYRVGTSPGLDSVFFLPHWGEFQKKYPDLMLHYSSHRSSTVVDLVAKGELDIGICFDPQKSPFIQSRLMQTIPHSISVRKRHPLLKRKKIINIKDLMDFSCCSPKAYPGIESCKQHDILSKNLLHPKIDFIFDSYDTAAQRILNSNSWCFLPKNFADHYKLEQIKIKGLVSEVKMNLIWSSSRNLPTAFSKFIEGLTT